MSEDEFFILLMYAIIVEQSEKTSEITCNPSEV